METHQRRRHRASILLTLAGACGLIFLCGCPLPDEDDLSREALRRQIEAIVDFLDSPQYDDLVSWEQHVVLCYRLAQGRDPVPVEFEILKQVSDDPGIDRSEVLALALGGVEERVTWENLRRFVGSYDVSSFLPDASVTEAAKRLTQTPGTEIARALEFTPEESRRAVEHLSARDHRHTTSEPGVDYQTYFGFLHAHSHLSDGEGGALEAYTFARDQGGLDFFGLTDHGINLFIRWPWESKWQRLRDAAEDTYAPGTYVTLWGFEWSNPFLGHVGVINSVDFTHTLARISMSSLYDWLRDRPDAFARFNHPGWAGVSALGGELREFDHFDLHPEAIPQMVGLELWNEDKGFDQYYYSRSWNDSQTSFLDVGIQKGWQLGPVGGQDNHEKQWGTLNEFRTAVLAEELTREGIIDAYEKRRIYATEDKDLVLDFRASGYPMGSHLSGVAPQLEVTARDGNGDTFQSVRLYRNGVELGRCPARNGVDLNGVELGECTVADNSISATFIDTSPTQSDYYYVIVTQDDDSDRNGRNDEAISSPIWIDSD